ncbi:MAG: SoxR reducing system RseC family protein [Bacteroidales bacterium]|nr:SoxR reducing system RseC family protein [Bacteroidales bacterium]
MDSAACIDRIGIVEEVGEKSIRIKLTQESACSSCSSKSVCSSEKKDFTVDINGNYFSLQKGDEVIVRMKNSTGYKALAIGYGIPFLLVVCTLSVATLLGFSELISGIFSISILVPYYGLLYFFKGRLKETLAFTVIQKMNV